MARLIDADALHEALNTKQKWVVRCGDKHNEGYTYDQVHFAIDEAPTIDAVSVVHGEWIEQHENGHGFWVGVCSRCGEENLVDNYCPNCGCRMKGADDE